MWAETARSCPKPDHHYSSAEIRQWPSANVCVCPRRHDATRSEFSRGCIPLNRRYSCCSYYLLAKKHVQEAVMKGGKAKGACASVPRKPPPAPTAEDPGEVPCKRRETVAFVSASHAVDRVNVMKRQRQAIACCPSAYCTNVQVGRSYDLVSNFSNDVSCKIASVSARYAVVIVGSAAMRDTVMSSDRRRI